MAKNTKVPSQAASGKDTFSDNLVGFQITDGSSQMTATSFSIDKTIPEKDSKTFHTQPFSDFLTLDTLKQETDAVVIDTITTITDNRVKKIKFYGSKNDAGKALFGSLNSILDVSVKNIIEKFPASIFVDPTSPVSATNISADSINYDILSNTTEFKVQKSLLYNPFDVSLNKPKSFIQPETNNSIRNFHSSYTKYVIDLGTEIYDILTYSEEDINHKISIKVNGNPFANSLTGYTGSYNIRPNNGIVEEFFSGLDELETILLDRDTIPKYQAKFKIPKDVYDGSQTQIVTETANWPLSRDGWNLQIVGLDFDTYITTLNTYGTLIDEYKSNLVIRFLTAEQLYEFDTEDQRAQSIFQIYGQSFDRVKKFIDNIAYMRNVSYDKINNVPDILLKNLAETLGLSTVNLYDEKSLQDSLYIRHDTKYDGVSNGTNLLEGEYEFYRRLLVNLAQLYKAKGTRLAIEFFLKFIGAPDPMIRLDEYVYKLDGPLPKVNYEDDIRDVIQGVKQFSSVQFVPFETTISGVTYPAYSYRLVTYTGYTNLSRGQYPVDDYGLPRKITSTDGSMFFQKGAGWYRKTLDHRSSDELDRSNSNLIGNIKTIKTKSKSFTYGENYFDVYRRLPGLDYGFEFTSEIDNKKIEIITDTESAKYTLNRKNINVFLAADRAIDYDIYRKSQNLSLTFGSLLPQTGKTFAQFLQDVLSNNINNSEVIKYKKHYYSLKRIYKSYQDSIGFTPYNYIMVNEFIERMSPYWTRVIEQFIPATTLWLGGNLIENGSFNRSKYQHRQPCTPKEFTEILYPNFENVIEEDLETMLGGGGGLTDQQNENMLRGLLLFSGMTYTLSLNIDGVIYSGITDPIISELFSGFTPNSSCTKLTQTTTTLPLICEYKNWIVPNITGIKQKWKQGLVNLVNNINSNNLVDAPGCIDTYAPYTGKTGISNCPQVARKILDVEFFTDTDGTEKVKFTSHKEDYNECRGIETLEFYFVPNYITPKQDCGIQILFESPCKVFSDSADNCQLIDDIYITVISSTVTGLENDTWPVNFFVTTGSTCGDDVCTNYSFVEPRQVLPIEKALTYPGLSPVSCTYILTNVKENEYYDIIVSDAAN